ncbi:hypothetical protein PDN73_24800 [Bacillus cereus]|nr:hypothetical protein [Bacillus cereus]
MKIFKLTIESTMIFNLSVETYEDKTHRRAPYYTLDKGKPAYFAVCPGCNNPIKLVNLYDKKVINEDKTPQPLHARHRKGNVPNIAGYSQEKYDNCPLRKKNLFGNKIKEPNPEIRDKILELVLDYPDILHRHIKDITNINFSTRQFISMVVKFIETKGYYYQSINEFNLPYGFLYMQHSIRIINQYVKKDGDQTIPLTNTINKSTYFRINNNQIIKLDDIKFAEISCYFTKHRKIKYSNETVEFRITESKDNKTKVLLKETLQMNQSDYINELYKTKQEEKEYPTSSKINNRNKLKNDIQKVLEQRNLL